jgi:hypothetical protein
MRKLIAIGIVAAAAISAAGIAPAQSQAIERNYAVGSFDKVAGVGPNHFVISVGGSPSVRASGPARTLDVFEVVVEDGELSIRPKEEYRHRRMPDGLAPATYRITLPKIRAAVLAGSGDMSVDRIDSDAFSATLAGSGRMDLDRLAVDEAVIAVAGSGDIAANGRARVSRVSVAGSGNIRAGDLRSETAAVSVAGSGDTDLGVDGDAEISIIGSGDVRIAGTTRCQVSRMGSGRATCIR